MFKSVRNNTIHPSVSGKQIKIIYNDGKCYTCNNSKLLPITNDGSVSFCEYCNIKILVFDFIEEDEYKRRIDNVMLASRLYNPSSVKKENFRTI